MLRWTNNMTRVFLATSVKKNLIKIADQSPNNITKEYPSIHMEGFWREQTVLHIHEVSVGKSPQSEKKKWPKQFHIARQN